MQYCYIRIFEMGVIYAREIFSSGFLLGVGLRVFY
jgi:hypothetical protein